MLCAAQCAVLPTGAKWCAALQQIVAVLENESLLVVNELWLLRYAAGLIALAHL